MTNAVTLTRGRIKGMTTTTDTRNATAAADALSEVAAAYRKRQDMAKRLADQDLYIGVIVRHARATGVSWAEMARVAQVSDVAILKASRRKDSP